MGLANSQEFDCRTVDHDQFFGGELSPSSSMNAQLRAASPFQIAGCFGDFDRPFQERLCPLLIA